MIRFLTKIVLTLSISLYACDRYRPDNQTLPPICVEAVNDGSMIYGDRLTTLNLEELLALQKCGLSRHPGYQLERPIAMQPEYPVPKILSLLQLDPDEAFQLALIRDLVVLAESRRHEQALMKDARETMRIVDESILKMQDTQVRMRAVIEANKLRRLFSMNQRTM